MRIVQGLSEKEGEEILAARANAPFISIEDAWRRSGIKPAALERLARADAFHCFGLDRRQALWAIKGLGQAPLSLFAAADERAGVINAEVKEAPVVLTPLTAGREVVEDYRATQLSLRQHPLNFLRAELRRRGIRPCGDLKTMKDGDPVTVAGIILVRQRPGSAKGILFLTLEDETGIANGVLWKDRFEAHRRIVMSSAMVSITGRVQREGIVIHVVTERVTDLTPLLRQVGEIDLPRMVSRGDGATHGSSPDRGDAEWRPKLRSDHHYREKDREDVIPIKSHDFH
jgi:error-prone DNA polymerase